MKLLCIILSTIIFQAPTNSQGKAGNDIPQNVISTFNSKYPHAGASNWKAVKDGFEVTFKTDDKKYCATYSAGGDWVRTERKIRWPKNLPLQVNKALKTGAYAAWYVDGMQEVDMPGQHVYLIHVDNANVLTIPDPYLFKDDYQLTFTESGELVKKEKLP